MGKSKSRNRSQERETPTSLPPRGARQALPNLTPQLNQIQDLRRALDPYQAALDLMGQVASIGVTDRTHTQKKSSRPRLRFDAPASVLVCIRRHTRKQVLFAKRKTGKGAKSQKRLTAYSKIRC